MGSIHTHCNVHTGVVISFERTDYVATEEDGLLEICINIQSGELERAVQFTVSTSNLSAIADQDFIFESALLSLDSNTSIVCVTVDIVGDTILESTEDFLVSLQSDDSAVEIALPELTVPILDSSNVSVGFVQEEYSVTEGGSVTVCVMLEGQIDRAVMVNVSTDNNGTNCVNCKLHELPVTPLVFLSEVLQPFESSLYFFPSQEEMICFDVEPVDNEDVENQYLATLTLETSDINVQLSPAMTVISITDDDSKCS